MRPSDIFIKRLDDFVEARRQEGKKVTEIEAPTSPEALLEGLPIQVRPRANKGVILAEDTYLELGNPSMGSCSFVLFTDEVSFVCDGRITLVGQEVHETQEKSLPFGQVIIVAGQEYSDENFLRVERSQFVADQIEGYMIRSVPQRMWSRISHEVAQKGFSFEALGRALMAIYKTKHPFIEAMEVLFVDSAREDVQELYQMASEAQKITKQIKKIKQKEYVTDEQCDDCNYEPICDEIKEMLKLRGIVKPSICVRED